MARGVCRGVQAFLAESCCCCRGVSASVGLAWLASDERRAVASRRVVRSSLPCLTVAVHRFAEPVKTEAVERTALLRLPCVSANQPALLNPDPGPRVDTLNHQLLHGLYTCCYTPIPRADQLQPHTFALLDEKEQQSGLARCPQHAVSPTRSTQARCAGKDRRKAPITPLRIYDDQTHNLCTRFQEGRWTSAPMGARRRSTTRKLPVRECAAHIDTVL
jgi:hypothetical protein